MFVAFPQLLATSFSGFYLAIMLVLWLLIGRGLGIDLRRPHRRSDVAAFLGRGVLHIQWIACGLPRRGARQFRARRAVGRKRRIL